MPSSEIMPDFHAGTLHSGGSGKVVTNPKQAVAIYHSYRRKEGREKPKRLSRSFHEAKHGTH